MHSVKRLLLVAPIVASLGMAAAPAAQARDGRNGAVAIGALLGLGAAALATGALAAPPGEAPTYYDAPPAIAYAPAPVYAPPPIGYAPPLFAYAPPPVTYVPIPTYAAPPPLAYARPPGYAVERSPYEGHWISYGHHRLRDEDDDN